MPATVANAPAATLKTRDRVDRQLVNSNRLIEESHYKSNRGDAILGNSSFVHEKSEM
jgi:hypothetical protein